MTFCPETSHQKCIHKALMQLEDMCCEKKLRLTDVRRRVFEIIWQSHKAVTAAEIMEKLGNNQPPMTYRALEFLTENKLIHKISTLNAYVGCIELTDEDYKGQLLVCSHCHSVTELKLPHPASQIKTAADQAGFQVEQMHLEVLGKCSQCCD